MNLIAAIDLNRCIGKEGELLYHIKKDMERFKELTIGKVVVMGRKTWDSLPKAPLKDRINVVITKNRNFKVEDKNVLVYYSFEEAEKSLSFLFDSEDIFIIGGESIYNYFMNKCDKFYITQIYANNKKGDKFLSEIPFDENKWEISIGAVQEENGLQFSFAEYKKMKKMITSTITEQDFCNLISKLEKEYNKKEKLANAIQEFDKECYFYPMGIESDVIDFLESITGDKERWVEYFIYELNFGKRYSEGAVKINNNNYELRTASQLYTLLWEINNKN